MKIKELLAPIVPIVIIGPVLCGIIYFLIGWEWLKGYLEIVFTLGLRWRDLVVAVLGWGLSLVCLSCLSPGRMDSERLSVLISAFPVRFFTAIFVIYIIWGREGIDALLSLGEHIPLAIIIVGLVVVLNVVSGVIKVIFQALLNVFNRRSGNP